MKAAWPQVFLWGLIFVSLSLNFAFAGGGGGNGGAGIGAITTALSDADGEIRSGVFPAVVGVLTAIMVIGVAAGVVRVITRNN